MGREKVRGGLRVQVCRLSTQSALDQNCTKGRTSPEGLGAISLIDTAMRKPTNQGGKAFRAPLKKDIFSSPQQPFFLIVSIRGPRKQLKSGAFC